MSDFFDNMSIIAKLYCREVWLSFLKEKISSGNLNERQAKDFLSFIKKEEYVDIANKIEKQEPFSPPLKKIISKQHSTKKRIVYSFSREENYVLKLFTYLLIRHYDNVFAKNLYSFRAHHDVHRAINYLKWDYKLSCRYVYKVDIHNYFNSVNINLLLPVLKNIMSDDISAYSFIERLLTDSRVVLPDGEIIHESKGIIAGAPISSFLANVYLNELDWYFFTQGKRYVRYSDDIIVFANTEEERRSDIAYIQSHLSKMSLSINREKESVINPHEHWDFLGISYCDGIFDISPVSAKKLKKKMWRKSRALLRWKKKKGVDNIRTARAFVKSFNKKLYDNSINTELTWTRWYFPLINTTNTLKDLDHYMQECVRYIATGHRNKKRYRFKYDMIKELGYRSLVNEYYKVKGQDSI